MTRSMTPSRKTPALQLVLFALLLPCSSMAQEPAPAASQRAVRQWPSSQLPAIPQEAPPCTCRYFGQRYDIGDSVCLSQPEGRKIAVCTMVINNPSWQVTNTPCPSAGPDQSKWKFAADMAR